jgi:hypothetical protein
MPPAGSPSSRILRDEAGGPRGRVHLNSKGAPFKLRLGGDFDVHPTRNFSLSKIRPAKYSLVKFSRMCAIDHFSFSDCHIITL